MKTTLLIIGLALVAVHLSASRGGMLHRAKLHLAMKRRLKARKRHDAQDKRDLRYWMNR
jgi:hypothetical protein